MLSLHKLASGRAEAVFEIYVGEYDPVTSEPAGLTIYLAEALDWAEELKVKHDTHKVYVFLRMRTLMYNGEKMEKLASRGVVNKL